ncbi:NAD(P)H-dependent oxidoreductase [Bradyrhizobium sp. 153]|nr:NAD(P)H-dependent oxidoreductase [Bradyrhizobium sp. 153]
MRDGGLRVKQTCEQPSISPLADISGGLRKILAAGALVLIFPIFWFSMPPILKGWIDHVFLSVLFYGGPPLYGRGTMVRRRAMVYVSLGARQHMFDRRPPA